MDRELALPRQVPSELEAVRGPEATEWEAVASVGNGAGWIGGPTFENSNVVECSGPGKRRFRRAQRRRNLWNSQRPYKFGTHYGRGRELLLAALAFQQQLSELPDRAQDTLKQAIAGLAAQAPEGKPDEAVLVATREHLAIKFAIGPF